MNQRPDVNELAAFASIVTHRSFRKAADALEMAPSTLSHMMRTLEARLGVRLLHRTTRSVSPTEAGERFMARVAPLLRELDTAVSEVAAFRDGPAGTLRINAAEPAVRFLLEGILPVFMRRHPQVQLDIVSEGRLVDIVEEGFDAGIRLAEAVPGDMIAVRLGGPVRFIAVASPAYLQDHEAPAHPSDLHAHACIRIRMTSGKRYAWEFEKDGESTRIDPPGTLSLDHPGLTVDAAARGLGIAYVPEPVASALIASGALVILLEPWSPYFPGLRLYYPGRRQVPLELKAFIAVMQEQAPQ